jgi:hypothetical protein
MVSRSSGISVCIVLALLLLPIPYIGSNQSALDSSKLSAKDHSPERSDVMTSMKTQDEPEVRGSTNLSVSVFGVSWFNLTVPQDSPPNASGSGMALDPVTDYILLFGGGFSLPNGTYSLYNNETWMMSPTGVWFQLHPPNAPQQRAGCALQYLAFPAEFVLFGGFNQTTVFSDTWIFSLATMNWMEVNRGVHPSPRGLTSTAPAAGHEGFYLFGGLNASGSLLSGILKKEYHNDMWLYTPSNGWKNVTPSLSPMNRAGAAMVVDGNGSDIMLSGGIGLKPSGIDELDDTWVFSPTLDLWTEVSQTLPSTTPLIGCATYNPVTRDVIDTGGWGVEGSGNVSWRWTLAGGWSSIPVIGGRPPMPFAGAGCAWDPALNGTLMFGGFQAATLGAVRFLTYNTTYLLREVGWSLSVPEEEPFLSGTPFPLSATAMDPSGQPWPLNLSLTLSDGSGTLSPHYIDLINGIGVVSAAVWTPDLGDVVSACQWEACVNLSLSIHGPASKLSIVGLPGTLRAGSSASVTIAAQDASGEPAWWWSGTALTCVVPGGNLVPVSITNGNGTMSLTWTHPGKFTLVATQTALQGAMQNFTVVPGTLDQLTASVFPTMVQEGKSMFVTILARDAYGNPVSVPEVNISDALGDFAPVQVPVTNGTANVTLTIGNKSGEDNVTVSAAGVHAKANSFMVEAPRPQPTPSSNQGTNWLPVEIGAVVAAAVIVAVIYILYTRRRKEKEREKEKESEKESAGISPLAFLPIESRDEDEKRESRNR